MPIWAPNWPSLMAFLACATAWRWLGGFGGSVRLGLDYPAVDVILRRGGHPDAVFADLQAMERDALQVWSETSE